MEGTEAVRHAAREDGDSIGSRFGRDFTISACERAIAMLASQKSKKTSFCHNLLPS
jgi:hypothetical protein